MFLVFSGLIKGTIHPAINIITYLLTNLLNFILLLMFQMRRVCFIIRVYDYMITEDTERKMFPLHPGPIVGLRDG